MLEQWKEDLKEAARDWLGPSKNDNRHLGELALQYNAAELSHATGGFSPQNRLGAGAAGAVYRGVLRGGTEVAVKVLTGVSSGFEEEVRVLSRFRHPNVVTLLGWGVAEHERYLVYELLTGGDVSKKLEKCRRDGAPFTWQERLRVAHDSACGLSHMLNNADEKAFHRDIKPANIMLDAGGGAKMADFGLASIVQDVGRQHLTVENIAGTPGYADPNYIQTGRVSEESEIYSFGIVLLELLLNQPPALAGPQGDIIYPLLSTVQPSAPGAHGRVLTAQDPRAAWPRHVVEDFAALSIDMVQMNPERRPLFVDVVRRLRHLVNNTGAGGPRGPPPGPAGLMPMPGPYPGHGMGFGGAPGPPWPPGPAPGAAFPGPVGPGMSPSASGRHGQGAGYGGGAPPAAASEPRRNSGDAASLQLAEVVLEAVSSQGLELAALPSDRKCIAFAVDPSKGRLSFSVGRQHQPEFFDRLVCKKEHLSSISRSHFELSWEPPATAPTLRKLSANPLLLDDRTMGSSEAPTVPDGKRIGFCGTTADAPCFLVLRVTLRSRGAVASEGAHPAVMLSLQKRNSGYSSSGNSLMSQAPTVKSPAAVVAVLECVKAVGGDCGKLPSDQRVIPIPLDEIVEIGRQHQPSYFFEQLLQADSRWLSFISRTHCRVSLQRQGDGPATSPSSYVLRVENLSNNAIVVKGKPLPKGKTEIIPEGASIMFVANSGDGDTTFLEFKLRRARGIG